jgi:hypothetical protein
MRDDAVANLHARHVLAYGSDFTGPVGDRNKRKLGDWKMTARHGEIEKIQAGGAQPHQHFTRSCDGIGQGGGFQGVERGGGQFDGMHGNLLWDGQVGLFALTSIVDLPFL